MLEVLSKHIGVKYVYAEAAPHQVDSDHEMLTPVETQIALSTIPDELLIRLIDGLDLGDMKVINQTIVEISEYHASRANTLDQLAQRFQFHELLLLVRGEKNS